MSIGQRTYSSAEIQGEITRLLEQFKREPEAVIVTDHGKPVMAIVPWQLYELITQAVKSKHLPH